LNNIIDDHQLVTVGVIAGAHGIAGWIKIRPWAQSDDIFVSGRQVIAQHRDGRRQTIELARVKPHQRFILARVAGIDGRDQAQALVGINLMLDKALLPPVEADEYYWADLLDMTVLTQDGEHLGQLTDIIRTGANDVYVVADGNRETLIPAIASVIRSIDIPRQTMIVDLPDGL